MKQIKMVRSINSDSLLHTGYNMESGDHLFFGCTFSLITSRNQSCKAAKCFINPFTFSIIINHDQTNNFLCLQKFIAAKLWSWNYTFQYTGAALYYCFLFLYFGLLYLIDCSQRQCELRWSEVLIVIIFSILIITWKVWMICFLVVHSLKTCRNQSR